MAQAKALDALAPFIALSKTSNSPRQTADVISRATSHPSTFVFAELLHTPRARELAAADPEYAAYHTVLRIFSYGTYADYVRGTPPQTPASQPAPQSAQPTPPLPALNEAQELKLRQLSLITLATDHASLTYDHLSTALSLGADDAKLESLVVSAVYAGLIVATLDPASRIVRISSVAPLRDVAPGSLPKLHASLRGWSQRCDTTLADLDAQIAGIRKAAAARADAEQKWDAKFKRAVDDEKKAMLGWRPAGSGSHDTAMSRTMTLNVGGSHAMQRQQPVRMNKRGSNGNVLMDDAGDDSRFGGDGDDNDEFGDDVFDDGAMDLDEGGAAAA
ncbi:cop9 signalosome subunit 7 [Ophiostoma piceae UAMH 11346]|uniref:Cop9 signalosome subunit 7 n=1 Tax=Ophiostoma piceae (strain UAMH 11346) TaxID=1262450 RepID=S3BSW7_OPHP1|nr:cop9 signalosome subunit 7 [Ophiostoma piceae UAMH 11346]